MLEWSSSWSVVSTNLPVPTVVMQQERKVESMFLLKSYRFSVLSVRQTKDNSLMTDDVQTEN